MYNSQIKFTSVLDLKESYELFENQARDIIQTAYKNKINQIRKIYIKFMLKELLAGTIRSSFFIRQKLRMER